MTLLITIFAAVVSTVIWYKGMPKNEMKTGLLCWMYWGASIMWLVDAIFEFTELREAYFTPTAQEMLNDTFLGLSVVALGLVIWIVRLLIADPKGVIRAALFHKENSKEQPESVNAVSGKESV